MSSPIVFGVHAVEAVLKSPLRTVKVLYHNEERSDERLQKILQQAQQKNIRIVNLPAKKMQSQFPDFAHQGIVAEVTPLPNLTEQDLPLLLQQCEQAPFILILDGVTDPHNLGACLRTADAAGVNFVIIPKDKSASITPVVSKVACGAAEFIPLVRVTNLVRAMEALKQEGVWIYGAAGEAAQTIYELNFKSAIALALGAEGDGLRRLTRERCDGLFSLPMVGSVESLNVSVAAGVSTYEVVRQRLII